MYLHGFSEEHCAIKYALVSVAEAHCLHVGFTWNRLNFDLFACKMYDQDRSLALISALCVSVIIGLTV